mmetsp:Transcript_11842/g.15481  ORF Transcript_11842/g.15481 Transcript_11842/m.15481 type:complete len:229 (-) Transcript_11842:140-826(-)
MYCFLDFSIQPVAFNILFGLENGLYIAVALEEALAVDAALLEMLLPAGVDPFQQGLQLRLLLLTEFCLFSCKYCCICLLHILFLSFFHLVSNFLYFLSFSIILLTSQHVLSAPPLQKFARPLRRAFLHLPLQVLLEFQQIHCMALRHLLDVHLRHAVILFHVFVPGRIKIIILHIMCYLNILALCNLSCADLFLLALLLLGFEHRELAVGPPGLQVVPFLLALHPVLL